MTSDTSISQQVADQKLKDHYALMVGLMKTNVMQARALAASGDPMPLLRCLWPDVVLDDFQEDIIRSMFDSSIREMFVKGCVKAGKGCAVAMGVNLWYEVHPQSKAILTSQSHKHAVDVIFGEVAKWRRRADKHALSEGNLGVSGIADTSEHYVEIVNPELSQGEGFSGRHGPATLLIIDEATAVPSIFYDMARTQARLTVAIANPRTLSGWFRDAFRQAADANATQTVGVRRLITVGGDQTRNVREGRIVIPDQIEPWRFEQLMRDPDPRKRDVLAMGRFPDADPQLQVVMPDWLERHIGAWREGMPVDAYGLDVAASFEGDSNVLAGGSEAGVASLRVWKERDTMKTVANVLLAAWKDGTDLKLGQVPVCVDMDGLGVGVGDSLAEQGVWVVEHRGGKVPANPQHYANVRAETFGELGRRLDPSGAWGTEPWALPPDEMLHAELVAIEKLYKSDAVRWSVTPKERQPGMLGQMFRGQTLREKLGRSPDRADAVAMLWRVVAERLALARGAVDTSGQLVYWPESEETPVKSGETDNVYEWMARDLGHGGDDPW